MMREKEMKERLMAYTVPAPDQEKINQGKKEIESMFSKPKESLSYGQFLFEQFRFIGIRSWIIEGVMLCFIMAFAQIIVNEYQNANGIAIVAALTPFLIVAQAEISGRSYEYKMNELESATKFSLKHLLNARICVFGVIDLLALCVWILYFSQLLHLKIAQAVVYTCVPFNVTAIGMFLILLKGSEEYYYVKSGILSVGVAFLFLGTLTKPAVFYGSQMLVLWYVAFAVTAFIQIAYALRVVKKAGTFSLNYELI